MTPLVTGALAVTAFLAGTVDAIAGGGGLITVPALVMAGLDYNVALATNKGQSVWGSGASMVAFWRAGRIDRAQAVRTFPLGILGAAGGAALQLVVPNKVLAPVVVVLLACAAVLMLVKKPSRDADHPEMREKRRWVAMLLALGIAAYDGFFGPGTGTFLIIGFVSLCGRSLVGATADAKVVNFASNLASVATFAYAGNILWEVALPMAVGQLCGGILGARLAIKGGARLVRLAVVAVSIAMIVKLVIGLLPA